MNVLNVNAVGFVVRCQFWQLLQSGWASCSVNIQILDVAGFVVRCQFLQLLRRG